MKKIVIPIIMLLIILLSIRLNDLKNLSDIEINVRNKPNTSGEIISIIKPGESVQVIETYNEWVKIKYQDSFAYTYRVSLSTQNIRIHPTGFVIPISLSYKNTPNQLIKDHLTIFDYKLPKHIAQIVLFLIVIIVQVKFKKGKKRDTKKDRSTYSHINRVTNELKTNQKVKTNIETQLKVSNQPAKSKNKKSRFDWEKYNKKKGNDFEDFIARKFPKKHYVFLDWVSDKTTLTGLSPESNKNPDLKFKHRDSGKILHIECKYRFDDNASLEDWRLKRYKRFGAVNKENVFIAFGTGGKPNNPDNLYIIPTYKIKNSEHIHEIKENYRKKNTHKNLYLNTTTMILK